MAWNQGKRGGGGGGPADFGDLEIVPHGTAPTLPSAGNIGIIARRYAGWTLPVLVDSAGAESIIGPDRLWSPDFRIGFQSGPTIFHEGVPGLQTAGTLSIIAPSTASVPGDLLPRMQHVATGVGAGAGWSTNTAPGNPSGGNPFIRRTGFLIDLMFRMAGTHALGQTCASGLSQAWTTGTPASFNNLWQVGFEATDPLVDGLYFTRRAAGAAVREALGAAFPRNATSVFRLFLGARADDTTRMFLTLINVGTGAVIEREATTDIPGIDVALNLQCAHNQQASGVSANMQTYYAQGFFELP
jgi:hypothetical protein